MCDLYVKTNEGKIMIFKKIVLLLILCLILFFNCDFLNDEPGNADNLLLPSTIVFTDGPAVSRQIGSHPGGFSHKRTIGC